MASKTKSADPTKAETEELKIDPAPRYVVQLARSVKLGPITHYPRNQQIMSGKLLQRIIDQEGRNAIVTADPR
jgi:hypothetical protein